MPFSDLYPSITQDTLLLTNHVSLHPSSRHLLGTLNYLDMTRVGVWGWGYGGYVTAMLMGSQQEVFKCGVAVSPIVDWLYYSKRCDFSFQAFFIPLGLVL